MMKVGIEWVRILKCCKAYMQGQILFSRVASDFAFSGFFFVSNGFRIWLSRDDLTTHLWYIVYCACSLCLPRFNEYFSISSL